MSFLGGTHAVRWYNLPVLEAGPGLGLLSLCSLYHYLLPFLIQSASYWVWAAVPWGPCPNIMKALLLSQPRSQEQGGFWLEHTTPRVGVSILRAPLHVPAVTPPVVCYKDTSHCLQHFPFIHSTAKLRFTLLLAWSSSVLNPSCTVLCPNRPSISLSDACFELYTGVTGSADSGAEALSHVDFPRWILC